MRQKIVVVIVCLMILGLSGTALVWLYRTRQHSEWVKKNGIAINEENFPNKWLRKVIDEKIDKNGNHFLSDQERVEVKELLLFMGDDKTEILPKEWGCFPNLQKVTFELGGTERCLYLRNLKGIRKVECRILLGKTNIECEGMADLTILKVVSEKKHAKTSLSVGNSPVLNTLYVEGEGIHNLIVSEVPVLKKLEVRSTSVTKLDFCSQLQALKELTVTEYTASLNLAGCRSLEELNVKGKYWEKTQGIPQFTLSDIPMLMALSLSYMDVKTLDLHSLCNLEKISINSMNCLSELVLYDLPKIEELEIDSMPRLKKIDFNKLESLRDIDVYGLDKIKKLDLRNQKDLGNFKWQNGKLEKILWGKKEKLEKIIANENKLSGTLNLSDFPKLEELEINNNSYKELLGKKHKEIKYINCNNNQLKLIDLGFAENIRWVDGAGNPNVAVYLPKKKVEEGDFSYYKFVPEEDIGPNSKVYYK